MASLLLYTLGNSDLEFYLEEDPASRQRIKNYRELTQQAFLRLEDLQHNARNQRLEFKSETDGLLLEAELAKNENKTLIVRGFDFPLLKNLMQELQKNQNRPGEICLFATRQTDARHHAQDTCFAAGLALEWLSAQYHYPKNQISIVEIAENPADYDRMTRFFSDYARENLEKLKQYAQIFIQLSAGTPAMIFSLASALSGSGLSPEAYYNPYQESPHRVAYFNRAQKEKEKQIITNFLTSMDYAGALKFFQNSLFAHETLAEKLLNTARHLKNFNLQKAQASLSAYKQQPELKKIQNLLSDLNLDENKKIEFLASLLFRSLENEELLETAAFLSALADILLKKAVEKYTGVKIIKENKEFKEFNEMIQSRFPDLLPDAKNNPSKSVLGKILDTLKKQNPSTELKEFNELNKDFRKIGEIRNDTPFAHGLNGIDETKKEALKEIARKIKEHLKIKPRQEMLTALEEKILELLKV